jgi:hypothetical protein
MHRIRLDREQAHQERHQSDKHHGVQNQATQFGRTFWGCDPSACDGPNELVRLGVGDDNERESRKNLKLQIGHF